MTEESNLASANQEDSNPILKPRPFLQIKTASLARLRQAAKNLSPLKSTQNKDLTAVVTADKNQKNEETVEDGVKKDLAPTNGVGNDVIISSTGSSPAHSPKPEDLTVLSTPPKLSKTLGIKPLEVSKNLGERFESPDKSVKQNDNLKQTRKEDIQVEKNASESKKSDNDAKVMDVDKKEEGKKEVGKETRTAKNESEEKAKIDFNATELKKVRKISSFP